MTTTDPPEQDADVCIVGAGLCGLNALYAVSRHLKPGQRVVLIDRRERVGGMWNDAYPYVRLHQPHGMFTAGDIAWEPRRDRSHLASRSEVLDHFGHCVRTMAARVQVDEFFGWTLTGVDEAADRVTVTATASDGRTLTVRAARLIKAFGMEITPNPPLRLSSAGVQSVSPNTCDVRTAKIRDDRGPVWIIGDGKTGMDTAHALLTGCPGREVNVVAGDGTYYLNRDHLFPTGLRRWYGGHRLSRGGQQTLSQFDGTNAAYVRDWYRERHGLWLAPRAENFQFGLMGEAEMATIRGGVREVVMGRLIDVTDGADGPQLLFADGSAHPIAAGSWIVNCTGYVLRDEQPYEPYISPGGRVLSVNTRSATHFLTSAAGFFLGHLFMLDKASTVPLYELDLHTLVRRSKAVYTQSAAALAAHNISVLLDAVPTRVFAGFGLDYDRWYPPARRVGGALRFLLGHRALRARTRAALDTVGQRYDVRCGPLAHVG